MGSEVTNFLKDLSSQELREFKRWAFKLNSQHENTSCEVTPGIRFKTHKNTPLQQPPTIKQINVEKVLSPKRQETKPKQQPPIKLPSEFIKPNKQQESFVTDTNSQQKQQTKQKEFRLEEQINTLQEQLQRKQVEHLDLHEKFTFLQENTAILVREMESQENLSERGRELLELHPSGHTSWHSCISWWKTELEHEKEQLLQVCLTQKRLLKVIKYEFQKLFEFGVLTHRGLSDFREAFECKTPNEKQQNVWISSKQRQRNTNKVLIWVREQIDSPSKKVVCIFAQMLQKNLFTHISPQNKLLGSINEILDFFICTFPDQTQATNLLSQNIFLNCEPE
jgi:hypothetical protein